MSVVKELTIKDAAGRTDELQDLEGDRLVVNMGPSHPSTHGVLRIVIELDGETILRADPDIGYLHRGDEKIAENMTWNQFVPYTDRLDYLAPLANNVAYALAVEKLMGLDGKLPPRCQYIRVICCELARISAHLLGLGAFAMDVGAVSRALAIDYGLTGPNLRGSGVEYDVRKAHPYLCYADLEFDIPVGSVGDCYDRYLVRTEEMRQSVRIIRQALKKIPGGYDNAAGEPVNVPDGKVVLPPKDKVLTSMEELIHQFMLVTQGQNAPKGEVYFGAENPKGELGFYINSRGGGTPYRLKIRAPSFCNLSILPVLLPGNLMSDVVAILGSLDFVMGECDR